MITGGNDEPEAGNIARAGTSARCTARASYRASRSRRTITTSRSRTRSSRSTPRRSCIVAWSTIDPVACAAVTRDRIGPDRPDLRAFLQNIDGINTDGLDVNFAYRTAAGRAGARLASRSTTPSCSTMTSSFRRPTGIAKISREGTEQGSPDQAFPKHKAIGIIDWTARPFGADVDRTLHQERDGISRTATS